MWLSGSIYPFYQQIRDSNNTTDSKSMHIVHIGQWKKVNSNTTSDTDRKTRHQTSPKQLCLTRLFFFLFFIRRRAQNNSSLRWFLVGRCLVLIYGLIKLVGVSGLFFKFLLDVLPMHSQIFHGTFQRLHSTIAPFSSTKPMFMSAKRWIIFQWPRT